MQVAVVRLDDKVVNKVPLVGGWVCRSPKRSPKPVRTSYWARDGSTGWPKPPRSSKPGTEKALTIATDVSVPEQCQALVDSAMQTFGRVDVLINNAGVGTAHPATRETPDQFRSVIDVNLNGAYWVAQAGGRVMQPGSSIINIASVLGITTASLPQAAYSASKAAIIGLTRDLAQQWGSRKGIQVNALAPGFFKTEMTDEYQPGYLDSQAHRLILGRLGDARELAATAVWLASAAGGYVTGQTIVVSTAMASTHHHLCPLGSGSQRCGRLRPTGPLRASTGGPPGHRRPRRDAAPGTGGVRG